MGPKTTITLIMEFDHPLWQGDGEDEAILVHEIKTFVERELRPISMEVQAYTNVPRE